MAGALAALAIPVGATPAVAADQEGLVLLSRTKLSDRLWELTFQTDALDEPTGVRVLLPTGYDTASDRRYPVLLLLHGGTMDHRSWTDDGDAARITEPYPVITVMPDGGSIGYYSDWFNYGHGGTPRWEHYHIRQLVPWIDANLRTVGDRRGRAVAGLSMGGAGAMFYASRHPDLFCGASAFSGDVDNLYSGDPVVPYRPSNYGSVIDQGLPGDVWGPRETERIRWRDHNPSDLAPNLRGLRVALYTGNGIPGGPLDLAGLNSPTDPWSTPNPVTIETEQYTYQANLHLHQTLSEQAIPHIWQDYGNGVHIWPYWIRDFEQDLPELMAVFDNPPAAPSQFSYRTAEPNYEVWGWSVAMERPAMEFSELSDVTAAGLTVTGSGAAHLTTPSSYRRGARYQITLRGPYTNQVLLVVADSQGRLTFTVVLGPGNQYQEDSAQAAIVGATTQRYSAQVWIARA